MSTIVIASVNAQPMYQYQCKTNHSLTVSYSDKQAVVKLDNGKVLLMRQVVAASGTRYQNAGYVFWSKGDTAFLDLNNRPMYQECLTQSDKRH